MVINKKAVSIDVRRGYPEAIRVRDAFETKLRWWGEPGGEEKRSYHQSDSLFLTGFCAFTPSR